jgi:hypothetical protein
MNGFKGPFKVCTSFLTVFSLLGIVGGVAFFAAASREHCLGGLAYAVIAMACLVLTFAFALINVIASMVVLNRKTFQHPGARRFARTMFWINAGILALFLLPALIGTIAQSIG